MFAADLAPEQTALMAATRPSRRATITEVDGGSHVIMVSQPGFAAEQIMAAATAVHGSTAVAAP